jgi:hypothetical protein
VIDILLRRVIKCAIGASYINVFVVFVVVVVVELLLSSSLLDEVDILRLVLSVVVGDKLLQS